MNFHKARSAGVKLASLQLVVDSDLTLGDKLFLLAFIEAYLPKEKVMAGEERLMKQLEVLEETWVERALREGRQEGKHELLLYLLNQKFGNLPEGLLQQLKQITDDEIIHLLSRQVLFVDTLAELKLPETA